MVYVHKITEDLFFEGKLMSITRYKFSKSVDPSKRGTWLKIGDINKRLTNLRGDEWAFRNWLKDSNGNYDRRNLTRF
jgi:Zn-finger nucleic acid-binding protein